VRTSCVKSRSKLCGIAFIPTRTRAPAATATRTAVPSETPTPALSPTSTRAASSTPSGAPSPSATPATLAAGPPTSSWVGSPWLWGGGLLVVLVVAGTSSVVGRALVYTRRDLRLKELMLARDVAAAIYPGNVVARLGQLAFDACGECPGIDQVLRVVSLPLPAILTLGQRFDTYVFTPAPPRTFQRHCPRIFGGPVRLRGRFRIDEGSSGPTVLYELRRIWDLLAQERALPEARRALPRSRHWWLYVVASSEKRRIG
jgi:hypothetical protein